jgi:hypothetical protein
LLFFGPDLAAILHAADNFAAEAVDVGQLEEGRF